MKKWIKIGTGITAAIFVVFVGISGYLGYTMTRVHRVPVTGSPDLLGLAYENVSFPGIDKNITLRGWLLPGQNKGQIIIMVHGVDANRVDASIGTLEIASGLVAHGFSVLMFDLRGHGESDGNMVSGGYYEKRDLEGAANFAKERGFTHIGVLGFSLGAVTSILAAAEDQDIDAVVSDSSFADLTDIMKSEFSKRTKAPQFLLNPLLFMIKIMYRVDFNAVKPVECVGQIAPRPVFFIHGEADDGIPFKHALKLWEASHNPQAELWIVPGAGHTRAYKTNPEEYMSRVTAFFDSALR